MDYEDELDSFQPHDEENTDNDDKEIGTSYETSVNVSLSWQQILFIIGINAIISLIISLAVVIIAGSRPTTGPEELVSSGAAVAEAERSLAATAASEPGQAPMLPSATLASSNGTTAPALEPTRAETLPTATPVEPTLYVVQLGDTLGSIASSFDVSLDDLMVANGIANPDYVQVGQELLIPIGGLPLTTPTATPVPVPTDTPLPFNPPTPLPPGTAPPAEPAATVGPSPTPVPTLTSASPNEIRLFLEVLNPGDLSTERVQIVNQGAFVRLTDWTLSDQAGNLYTFPDFSLWGGGAINIHTADGSNTTTDLYWGQPSPVWEIGDQATLSDAEGRIISVHVVPAP